MKLKNGKVTIKINIRQIWTYNDIMRINKRFNIMRRI
jgi:hypothetical protein